ncbi:MAG: hypothetical protein F6J86_35635 [Symploca sp. SIO1B1]|nr:hypothetical protein [Symploca sp. SIO1B1]
MIKLNQILKTSNNESKYISNTSEQLSCPQIEVQTEEPTLLYLINKVADIAVANQDAGLVIAAAIGTSVILWAIADAAAKLIKAARS